MNLVNTYYPLKISIMNFVIIADILMVFYIIKIFLDINGMLIKLKKNKTVNNQDNPLEKNYQFIKGLY